MACGCGAAAKRAARGVVVTGYIIDWPDKTRSPEPGELDGGRTVYTRVEAQMKLRTRTGGSVKSVEKKVA